MQSKSQARLSQINKKYVLKKILQHIMLNPNEYWFKRLPLLAKATTVLYMIQGRLTKFKENSCFKCKVPISNKLIYLLHLELVHNDQISVPRYQLSGDKLTIHILPKEAPPTQYLVQIENNKILLLDSTKNRYETIIQRVIKKLVKKQEKAKRIYYHSTDIFRMVGSDSEDEDSQAEIGYVERDLEKHRIAEFLDVNEKDKLLFQLWNDMVHEQKMKKKLLGHQEIKEVLLKFAAQARKVGLKRANLLTHIWTLWSFGKIFDQDILECLTRFDQLQA